MSTASSVFHLKTCQEAKKFVYGSWEEQCCNPLACFFLQGMLFICGLLILCCYQASFRWALLMDWGTQDAMQSFCEGKVGCCFCVCVCFKW